MEETTNRGPQLQLNRLLPTNPHPLHLRVMNEFDLSQDFNRCLYQVHPSKLQDLDLHFPEDEFMQQDPFLSQRTKPKTWELDITNFGYSGYAASGNDWRQSRLHALKSQETHKQTVTPNLDL